MEREMTISASKIFMLQSKIQSIVNELSGKEEEEYVIKNNFSIITLLCITLNVSIASPDKLQTVMQLKRAVGALLREQAKFYKKFHQNN